MAVSPAEEILRTLTYNYSTITGRATYTPTTGIIRTTSMISAPSGLSCNCFVICNNKSINVTKNGHYTLTFMTGTNVTNRTLDVNLKTSVNNTSKLDVTFSFKNLGASKFYTITFDADGFGTFGHVVPRLYNMTLVLGKVSYTYDNVFGPIATCSDIFAATGLEQDDTPETPSEVVYAANNKNTQVIINTDRTYEFEFFIINNPSQTYSNK